MRKEYIAPITDIVIIQYQQHLLENSPFKMTKDEASVNNENEYETLSREGSIFWDDED